ncbi:hypothetical protein A5819_000865 [Enterococcus sp. 7E2_DIV0204]|uniref:DUF1700 domain-containing protein n=1 Tax=unclassified Enterococcus TaxID=2608891 RepID=UPI000A34DE30|nr:MULTISPECIES: DUF1700 domain-containing protein [unclassified Enterococcus]OTN88384.1 hypothetical protein A5819_000865 [Enterococcus sp. 7E2_DIV0204]OTP50855.1 hypothetical protein A5884_000041 [Enterococcus sp. 7D2_DIV0200]
MNKQEFLYQLEEGLIRLNESEKNQFILYYDELIEDYLEDGASEAEAVSKLGKPSRIASKILEEAFEERSFQKKKLSPLMVVLLIIGFPLWGSILLTAILLILSAYIIIWCLPFTTGMFAVLGLGASIFSVCASFFAIQDGVYIAVTQMGISIFVLGLALLSGLATLNLANHFIKASKRFSGKIFGLFEGRGLSL